MKRLSAVLILLAMVSVANADMTLTVNGFDMSKLIEIESNDDIIIVVAGQTDEQKESYSVTCERGGKLAALPKPNSLAEKPKEGNYLFTFEDEELVLAEVNLTVGNVLDYQLVLFRIPDSNTVIFGIDSDALTPPQLQLEQQLPTSQAVLPAMDGSGTFFAMGAGDSNDILDPNWYPNLNNDQFVNFKDFAILATNWQQLGSGLDGDLNDDGVVDFNDMAILACYWLANTTGPSPEEVFESFKTALLADDLNAALGCFTETSAENYEPFLEQLRPYFQQMVNDMGEVVLISLDNNTAVYDVLREENGDTYGYPVLFVRDEMGQWKISDF